MSLRVSLTCSLALLFGLAIPARADFYATDWSSTGAISNLYDLNPTTGAATLVGSTGVRLLIGITADTNGTLYSVSENDSGPSNLYTINPTTGLATLVGSLGVATAEGDLAINPATGTLYVANALSDQLLTVNKTTGLATVVGSFGAPGRDVSGLLFSGGTLYGLALNDARPDTLVTINLTTGAATTVGSTGSNFGVIAALSQDPSTGTAYIAGPATTFGNDNQLWTINLATGAAVLSGPITGITSSISGLTPIPKPASAAPEPASIILAGIGLAGLGLVSLRSRARNMGK
ncbi:MAG TPA: PEP-CTERM sorting domain-containing protein [Isosphaeraceae bacterium]|jgi:DNA-binding beta-propeller fold protein YncE|nr:PEP-CTERM sorting domain-containing protein [Isosphaeraceae bacterium]